MYSIQQPSLYNLSEDMQKLKCELIDTADDETGEVNQDVLQQLQLTKLELDNKAIGYAYVLKSIDDEEEAYKREIERLTLRKKQLTNAKTRLKNALIDAMTKNEITEIKGQLLTLKLRKSESVEITDYDKLNHKYKRTKVLIEPDKIAIKEAIKAGTVVEGAELKTNQNLQIK